MEYNCIKGQLVCCKKGQITQIPKSMENLKRKFFTTVLAFS